LLPLLAAAELTTRSMDIKPVKAIADKIAKNYQHAAVWTIDAAKLLELQLAMRGMCFAREEWKSAPADAVSLGEDTLKQTSQVISETKYLEIVDFDDHLIDAPLCWLNHELFKGDPLANM